MVWGPALLVVVSAPQLGRCLVGSVLAVAQQVQQGALSPSEAVTPPACVPDHRSGSGSAWLTPEPAADGMLGGQCIAVAPALYVQTPALSTKPV